MSRRRATVTQADVARSIRAAKQAGGKPFTKESFGNIVSEA
jgi:hypothetical protein